ncbi:MAG TPA: LytR C-terminal domain-containing protein [Longimicrobiales bacterium]
MPMLKPITLSVISALSMAGCAIPMQKEADRPPAIQPVLNVNHDASAEAHYRLGRYFEGQARYDQAIAFYREALKRDPLLVEAYTGLGMALAAQQRYEDAVRQFQAAVVLEPQAAHLHNNLGYAYLLSGVNEKAVKTLEEAIRLDPGHQRARENLRIAQAKLASTTVQPALPGRAAEAVQLVSGPLPGASLVEISPQIFELRTPPKPRNMEKIEAVPLAPLPQQNSMAPTRKFKLEVSNGNGILGLAKRVAGRLVGAGVRATRLTNQRPFQQASTEVQYREGYAAEAAVLAATFPRTVQVKPSKDLARHIDVRLVLGKDVLSDTALIIPTRPTATTVAAR